MPSWIDRSGAGVDAPQDRRRPRGRNLSLESAIRLRDLLAALLVWGLRLSKPDAVVVLSLGAITEDHLRRRLKECPSNVTEIIGALRREAGA